MTGFEMLFCAQDLKQAYCCEALLLMRFGQRVLHLDYRRTGNYRFSLILNHHNFNFVLAIGI